ncbi:PE-PGRS family protein [Streptomyces sp. NPDC056672]|uniref:PE-PGRS family protein n=1 Tax=Streptomyces sp. NPDC056672 TaxID=3345906 RepID=UPI0036BAD405
MADFRRQPEWQQQADRHSQLRDPVLTVRPISRFEYTARKPVTPIDHALVFVTAKGAYDTYLPPHRPSRSDAATRWYTSVYEVDMGNHPVRLELELPSDDDAFSFGATADLTWRVSDPARYVASGERDVPTRLDREFHQFTRPVSRGFSIEKSRDAEIAVQQALEDGGFAADVGLQVTCTVRLRLDDEAIAHRRRRRSLEYERDMLAPEHEFQLQQARQAHELELLRAEQQQRLMTEKINFYQYHLQHGGVAAWALHLAAHPEDTRLAMGSMRQEQLALVRSQLELLNNEQLEDYQKAEPARQALRTVSELMRQQMPDLANGTDRPGPADEPGVLPAGPLGGGDTGAPAQPSQPLRPPGPGTPPAAPGEPPAARGEGGGPV